MKLSGLFSVESNITFRPSLPDSEHQRELGHHRCNDSKCRLIQSNPWRTGWSPRWSRFVGCRTRWSPSNWVRSQHSRSLEEKNHVHFYKMV